jgi:hypothetical protein
MLGDRVTAIQNTYAVTAKRFAAAVQKLNATGFLLTVLHGQ